MEIGFFIRIAPNTPFRTSWNIGVTTTFQNIASLLIVNSAEPDVKKALTEPRVSSGLSFLRLVLVAPHTD